MATIEELKRERDKLLAGKSVEEDFRKRDLERKQLEREIRILKNPKLARFSSFVKRKAAATGRAIRFGTKKLSEYEKMQARERKKIPRRKIRGRDNINQLLWDL